MDLLSRRNSVFAGVAAVGLLLDQLTKLWIERNLAFGADEITVIPGFLSIVHARNPGAAFGMFGSSDYRLVVFGLFTVIAIGVVVDMFRKLPRTDWFMACALGLVLSGAIGNAIDRVRQQYVTDFIRVYTEQPTIKHWLIENFGTYEWPSFNIADSALVIGVGMFFLHWLFVERRAAAAPPAAEGSQG